MFYTTLRVVAFVLLTVACAGAGRLKARMFDGRDSAQYKELKRLMTNMERPIYPTIGPITRRTGSGLFWMHFDKTGRVTAVKIIKSTEKPELDNAAVYAFYRWRCRPGEVDEVIVPVAFTRRGSHSGVGGHAY